MGKTSVPSGGKRNIVVRPERGKSKGLDTRKKGVEFRGGTMAEKKGLNFSSRGGKKKRGAGFFERRNARKENAGRGGKKPMVDFGEGKPGRRHQGKQSAAKKNEIWAKQKKKNKNPPNEERGAHKKTALIFEETPSLAGNLGSLITPSVRGTRSQEKTAPVLKR